ncbi:hypothetical protein ACJJTC_014843 [Scirpophaga incertulas]
MLQCVNCGLCVQRIQRHEIGELSAPLQNVLTEWLSLPQNLSDGVLCHSCYLILIASSDEVNPRRRLGHTQVCIGCGISVLNIRNHILEENNILLTVFSRPAHLEGQMNHVCHPCWLRGRRRVSYDARRASNEIAGPVEQLPRQNVAMSPIEVRSLPVFEQEPARTVTTIHLPGYKRFANTSRHCIFNSCRNIAGHLVPTFTRVMLIKEHNLYVPRCARVCEEHLYSDMLQLLPEAVNTLSEFSSNQLQDMLDLAKRETIFDFENVHEMPSHICHYWTGLNVSEFLTLFNELSLLHNYRGGRLRTIIAHLLLLMCTQVDSHRPGSSHPKWVPDLATGSPGFTYAHHDRRHEFHR